MLELVFEYKIGSHTFDKLWLLVDGIYPELARFVKTISVPLNADEQRFVSWQECARKDVEHAFGVLLQKNQIIRSPLERCDEKRIKKLSGHVLSCIT